MKSAHGSEHPDPLHVPRRAAFLRWAGENQRQIGLALFHMTISMVVWQDAFLSRRTHLKTTVPDDANRAALKRLVPAVAYGLKHIILYQFCVLLLTMCHGLTSRVTSSNLEISKYIPMELKHSFHIKVGYITFSMIILATMYFFIFYGILCADHKNGYGPEDYCFKLGSEIMITGYTITGLFLVLIYIAYDRARYAYELFYYSHQFFLIILAVSVILARPPNFNFRGGDYAWIQTSQIDPFYVGP